MFLLAAVASGLLTIAWIRFARSRRIEDHPGQRRLHATSTPRGGGIAIALATVAAASWLSVEATEPSEVRGLAVGAGLFAMLGLADDLLPVPTWLKFILQMIAASILVIAMTQLWSIDWLLIAALVIACCYVVNIWNFMDGSNGLIAVQALMISLAIALWPGQPASLRLIAFALAGACAGFLPFNLPGARVFLGDIGSHVLGAAVFGLLLWAWHVDSIDWMQALLMTSALLLDSGYTLLRRLLAGRRVWRAHRDHLYQYAVRCGNSHLTVCLAYAAYTGFTIVLALLANAHRSTLVPAGLLIFAWLLGTLLYFGLRRYWLNPGTHRGRAA